MKTVKCNDSFNFLYQGEKISKQRPNKILEFYKGSVFTEGGKSDAFVFPPPSTSLPFDAPSPVRFLIAGYEADKAFVTSVVTLRKYQYTAVVDCTGECPICPDRDSIEEGRSPYVNRIEYIRAFLTNARTIRCATNRLREEKNMRKGDIPNVLIICREGKKRSVGSFLLYFMLYADEQLKRLSRDYMTNAGPMESMLKIAEKVRPIAFTVKATGKSKDRTWVGIEETADTPREWTWAGLIIDTYKYKKLLDETSVLRYEKGIARLNEGKLHKIERDLVEGALKKAIQEVMEEETKTQHRLEERLEELEKDLPLFGLSEKKRTRGDRGSPEGKFGLI